MSAAFMSQALAQKAPGEILSLLLMVPAEGHMTSAGEELEEIFNDTLISSAFIEGEPHT